MKENITSIYRIFNSMYGRIDPLFGDEKKPTSLGDLRDATLRMGGFVKMLTTGEYRNYTQSPYLSVDIAGTFVPNVLSAGTLEMYSDVVTQPDASTVTEPIDYNAPIN